MEKILWVTYSSREKNSFTSFLKGSVIVWLEMNLRETISFTVHAQHVQRWTANARIYPSGLQCKEQSDRERETEREREKERDECILLSAANPTSQIPAPGKLASVLGSPSHFLPFTTSLCKDTCVKYCNSERFSMMVETFKYKTGSITCHERFCLLEFQPT